MMRWSTSQVIIGHHRGHINRTRVDLSVQAVEEQRPWLNAQQVDTYGTRFRGTSLDPKWSPPDIGVVKCNVNADWRNADMMGGVAWIARDCYGSVLYHAREVFTRSSNRIMAELRCILWAVQSLRDLCLENVIISSDCQAAIAALCNPRDWPRYGMWLDAIFKTAKSFRFITFELVSCPANFIARDIAESVIRDGRFNSYLAARGPVWLQYQLHSEAQRGPAWLQYQIRSEAQCGPAWLNNLLRSEPQGAPARFHNRLRNEPQGGPAWLYNRFRSEAQAGPAWL
ncbi:uncharacterized protein LOC110227789 [Arabidopsis lyrata subsp. lyrata]|uniref:uncharacterized protein LOC110227789 n=1 Tax=Arabidopsis lyrata subsp. lyrata TaxID=81972 RepID=UPI000A29CFFC|nr:uncharacterized protein LOC110227789 [Arabidopsis lyrata subsp. lyrata]|eukprot:XP_020879047.1 uncharacterized protein LOC110227789 [Arabidopsis lyrata subsp. lyrata]